MKDYKRNPFRTPENYFFDLKNNIQNIIIEKNNFFIKNILFKIKKPIIATSALILFILIFKNNTTYTDQNNLNNIYTENELEKFDFNNAEILHFIDYEIEYDLLIN